MPFYLLSRFFLESNANFCHKTLRTFSSTTTTMRRQFRSLLARINLPLSTFTATNTSRLDHHLATTSAAAANPFLCRRQHSHCLRMSKYTIVEKGTPNSTNYRVFFSK